MEGYKQYQLRAQCFTAENEEQLRGYRYVNE
jgi:hypothetical protein